MAEMVQMPKLKADMKSGVIKKWLKKPGEYVAAGEALFAVADGKLVKNVAAEVGGIVEAIMVEEGATAECGAQVASIVPAEAPASAPAEEMTVELKMPKVGNAANGVIKKWFKKEGDRIAPGEMLFSTGSGKLVQNITSEWNGTVEKIFHAADETVNVDEVVAIIKGSVGAAPAAASQQASTKIVVVGGGPGGYVAAIRAAQLGAKVQLIEKDTIGGTCLNVGCIPTKALLHSAELYHAATHGQQAGVHTTGVTLNWGEVQQNRERISKTLSGGVAGLLEMNGVEVTSGTAEFIAPGKLQVTLADGSKKDVEADKIILATGSAPVMPPIPGVAGNPDCINSTGALTLEQLPKSMVLIGGGVISVELACAYARFGTEVTIVEMLPRLLPPMDGELTAMAQQLMEENEGIKFSLETQVTHVEKKENTSVVYGKLKDGTEVSFEAEKVLVAVGRRPYTDGLGLEACGIEAERGRVKVNNRMETNVAGVYAIGDCNGRLMLAHTASVMGEIAAENAMGHRAIFDGKSAPSCVYCFPEFAGVGLTEEAAQALGRELAIGKFPMVANGKSLIMEATQGMVKTIADKKSGKILGVHILGARATDLIAEAALAIQQGLTVNQLIAAIHAHPSVAEAVRESALAVENRAIHIH